MSHIKLTPNASGTGTFSIASPATGTDRTLTLPDTSGTIAVQGGVGVGKVLQVVNATYSTLVTNSSSTYADTGITATITPTSSSSKILVQIVTNYRAARLGSYNYGYVSLVKNSTKLVEYNLGSYSTVGSETNVRSTAVFNYIDSPATTSATTYKMQSKAEGGAYIDTTYDGNLSTITLMEIGA